MSRTNVVAKDPSASQKEAVGTSRAAVEGPPTEPGSWWRNVASTNNHGLW